MDSLWANTNIERHRALAVWQPDLRDIEKAKCFPLQMSACAMAEVEAYYCTDVKAMISPSHSLSDVIDEVLQMACLRSAWLDNALRIADTSM